MPQPCQYRYHLWDGIVVEVYDETGTLVGEAHGPPGEMSKPQRAKRGMMLSDKQRWVMAKLASEGKLARRDVELEFGISSRTVKRALCELSDASMIEFDRSSHPGVHRLK